MRRSARGKGHRCLVPRVVDSLSERRGGRTRLTRQFAGEGRQSSSYVEAKGDLSVANWHSSPGLSTLRQRQHFIKAIRDKIGVRAGYAQRRFDAEDVAGEAAFA